MKSITVEIKARFDQLTAGFKGAADSVRRSLDDMGQKIDESSNRFGAMTKTLETAGGLARTVGLGLSLALTAPIVGVGVGAVKSAAQIETLQTAFVPLLGGAQAAKDRIADLQKFANTTPFEMPEVAKASRVLQVMTRGALATGDSLRLVGDVASGTNQPFQDVAMWVGRLYSGLQSGQPVGEATMRLMEMGAITTETKAKIESLQKAGVKGNEVWAVAKQDFALFAGGMAAQADTMAGKWSTLQDSARTALASIGASLAPVAKTLLDFLTKACDWLGVLAGWFDKMPGFVKGAIVVFAGLLAALGPLLLALGSLAGALTSIIAAWPLIVAGATAVGTAFAAAAIPILAIGAAIAAVVLAVDVLKNGWTATGREEIRQAREAARIEQETAEKVKEIHRKAAAERAQAAAAEQAKKAEVEAKAREEAEKRAKESAKRIADYRVAREQEVIDYANAAEQRRADHEMALRQRLADAEWNRRVAAELKADEEEAKRKAEAQRRKELAEDQALERTRERLAKEDAEEQKRADRVKAIWTRVGQYLSQAVTSPLQSAFGRFFESGKMGFSRLWQDMKNGFKAAMAEMAAKAVTSGIFKLLGMAVGAWNPLAGAAISASVPSFAVGTPYVQRDMLANIHEGERILTKSENRAFTAGELGGGAAGRGTLLDLDAEVLGALARNGSALVRINAGNIRSYAVGGV